MESGNSEQKTPRKSRVQNKVSDKGDETREEGSKMKETLYAYVSQESRDYVEELCREFNLSISSVIEEMIKAHKKNKKLVLNKHVPRFVERAEEWKQQHGIK